MGKVIKRARSRKKQETGKALRAPPRQKKFDGKTYDRWGGRGSKSIAERDAKRARKGGDSVRIVKGKSQSGKTAYWLYAESK